VKGSSQVVVRALTIAAVIFAVVVVALILFRSDGGYELTLDLENASQLVEGNEVKVGGIPVGVVKSVELTEDFRARVRISIEDDELTPLHRGTRVAVLFDSLTSVAGRYLSLTPGPADAPEIPDGGELGPDQLKAAIDPDQVLQTIDAKVQKDLRFLLRRSPRIFEGEAARQANAGFEALSPALSQGTALARELNRDERALTRLLTESADVVSALASRPDDLEQLTGNALAATSAIAERSGNLDSTLAQLPPTLRRTNTTLVNLRATLQDLRPLVRDTRPAVRPLTQVLRRVRPIVARARPVVSKLRRTVRRRGRTNDLLDALRGILPVAREGRPAFRSTARLLRKLEPIGRELRPYVPDLVGSLNAFTGTTSHYYDANGRYNRIGAYASLFSVTDTGSLVPLPQLDGTTGLRRGVLIRCPGAAIQQLPDRSNPYFEVPGTCRTEDNAR
jgi:phospholipid/cholesterol/gamma-HCH transport system substrate-binding protein